MLKRRHCGGQRIAKQSVHWGVYDAGDAGRFLSEPERKPFDRWLRPGAFLNASSCHHLVGRASLPQRSVMARPSESGTRAGPNFSPLHPLVLPLKPTSMGRLITMDKLGLAPILISWASAMAQPSRSKTPLSRFSFDAIGRDEHAFSQRRSSLAS